MDALDTEKATKVDKATDTAQAEQLTSANGAYFEHRRWDVTPVAQEENLCWDACGLMIWNWKHGSLSESEKRASYLKAASGYNKYAQSASGKRGLSKEELDDFYPCLGLSIHRPSGAARVSDLIEFLFRSPVILCTVQEKGKPTEFLHAMLAIWYEKSNLF